MGCALKCRSELLRLIDGGLPCDDARAGAWHALCLRRDIRALEVDAPHFGMSTIPTELGAFQEFDNILRDVLEKLDSRLVALAQGIPSCKI